MWTTVPPAKSSTPHGRRKPCGCQVQCASGQYTKIVKSVMNTRYAEKRTRSANDPVIRAGVITANFNWNIANSASGIVGREIGMGGSADAAEHEVRHRVADEAVVTLAERETESERDPDQAHHTKRHKTLQHRRDDVLAADHSAVEERQPRRHQQHQARGGEQPGRVAGIDWGGGRNVRSFGQEERHEGQTDEDQERNRFRR